MHRTNYAEGGDLRIESNGNVLELIVPIGWELRVAPSLDNPQLVRVWIVKRGKQ